MKLKWHPRSVVNLCGWLGSRPRTRNLTLTSTGQAPESVNHELIFRQISPLGNAATQSMTTSSHERRVHRCQIRMTSQASRCFGSVSCPCLWWVPVCWAEVPCCCYRRCPQYFTDFHRRQETAKNSPTAPWSRFEAVDQGSKRDHVRPNVLYLQSDAKSIFKNTWSRLLAAVKWLERTRMGLVAIPTKRNSVVISIAQKAAKCRNGF